MGFQAVQVNQLCIEKQGKQQDDANAFELVDPQLQPTTYAAVLLVIAFLQLSVDQKHGGADCFR
jgi:hypothetical protein